MTSTKTPVHAPAPLLFVDHLARHAALLSALSHPLCSRFPLTRLDPLEVLCEFALLLSFSFQLDLQSLNEFVGRRAHRTMIGNTGLTSATRILADAMALLTSGVITTEATWLFAGGDSFIGTVDGILER